MVFSAFKEVTLNFSSELFFIVYIVLQERIPCLKNFLRARANHLAITKRFLKSADTQKQSLEI